MASRTWLPVALAGSLAGCALTVRGVGGGALTPQGPDGTLGAAVGFGGAVGGDAVLLVSGAQGGARQVVATSGVEYDRNLGSSERPWGLRLRAEGGVSIEPATATSPAGVGGAVGLAPGLWWMPSHAVFSAHRFVVAVEARPGLRFGTEADPNVRAFGSVVLSFEWAWVPCTLFGGGSCRPNARHE